MLQLFWYVTTLFAWHKVNKCTIFKFPGYIKINTNEIYAYKILILAQILFKSSSILCMAVLTETLYIRILGDGEDYRWSSVGQDKRIDGEAQRNDRLPPLGVLSQREKRWQIPQKNRRYPHLCFYYYKPTVTCFLKKTTHV